MITDINNEPIRPGRYKYWLPHWSSSVKVTVKDREGVLYIRSNRGTYPTMQLEDIRMDAILERIED